ncbi:hypothetical protein BTA51_26220 [Hahella sp. CCB-MM4]|uniref:hypothetical protein n=1 Tax=Hahella sp. (strain CCB-MM4) TaxID=1926491 RepID=UPI000B9AA98E|nr:hypothetical protein [Hahella sp. CCB-MM4]OZG70342.1 hypothetical protein BTA51_26220 [Hahella sp. CCB-MM4]
MIRSWRYPGNFRFYRRSWKKYIRESENKDKELAKAKKNLAQQRERNKDIQKSLNQKLQTQTTTRKALEEAQKRVERLETALVAIANVDGTEKEVAQWNDLEWGIFRTAKDNSYRITNLQHDYSFRITISDGQPLLPDITSPPKHVVLKALELAYK